MKKIALALLATSSYANTNHIDHHHGFAVELAGGLAMMGGAPYSDTEVPTPTEQTWNNFSATIPAVAGTLSNYNTNENIPGGYFAPYNTMDYSSRAMGFAGQLNLHYMMKSGSLGAGVYAGVGLNNARSSSTYRDGFKTDETNYQAYLQFNNDTAQNIGPISGPISSLKNNPDLNPDVGTPVFAKKHSLSSEKQGQADAAIADFPTPKVTISSGLTLQAGARLGPIIGRFFPHLRVGWAAYQLRAHMTNQMSPFDPEIDINAAGSGAVDSFVLENGAFKITPNAGTATANIGDYSQFKGLYTVGNRTNVTSKGHQWSNAVTTGAGLDWSMNNKIMLGVYYQAAICQRTYFNQWNKDVTAGMTGSSINFPTSGNITFNTDNTPLPTSGKVITPYGSTPPTVSIDPIIQTVMFSAKYVINKT
jgi:hypothetical protein